MDTWRECRDCGQRYSPNLLQGGRLPRGYTACPACDSRNTVWLRSGKKYSLEP